MPPAAATDRVDNPRDQGQGGDFPGHVAARLDALRDNDIHPRACRPAGIRDRADLMEDLHARRVGTPTYGVGSPQNRERTGTRSSRQMAT